jgi:anaerobic ribonucleoside-triphosphate reductase activating protein
VDSDELALRIFRRESPVKVLGPYSRAVIWVQGCHFGCPNCIVPESWALNSGDLVPVDSLVEWALRQEKIEGITVSGGEPMLQAFQICTLIDRLRAKRDLGVVCYTGYTHEFLLSKGSISQKSLLQRIDLLIDGVYLEGRHNSLLWRGSENQRLIPLTERYSAYIQEFQREKGDQSAGVEVVLDADGGIGYAGVPAKPGFRDDFISGMTARGIRLSYALRPDCVEEGKNS